MPEDLPPAELRSAAEGVRRVVAPNEVLRDAGRLKAVRELRQWPLMMVKTIDQMNQRDEAALKAEKEKEANRGPKGPDERARPHSFR